MEPDEAILGYSVGRVVFTDHARRRMRRRRLDAETVYETLRNPTITLPRYGDETQEFRRRVGLRTHFVVVDYAREEWLRIITTGWSGDP